MIEGDDIKPAGYSKQSKSESKSIKILDSLLDDNFVASFLSKNDKTPNHDGSVDLIENDHSVGKLEIQVKTLRINYSKPSYPIKLSLLAYIRNAQLPFLFIAVDQSNFKAFWHFIDRSLASNLIDKTLKKKETQKSTNINFNINNEISTNPPYKEWNQIVQKEITLLKKAENINDELVISKELIEELKLKLNSIDKKAEYTNLNLFIEKLNTLVNNDFKVVKKLFVTDFWKFGIITFGEISREKISYSLFQIETDENVKLINSLGQEDFLNYVEAFQSVKSYYGSNPIFNNHEKYAYDKIREYINILLDRKILSPNNDLLKNEFLFSLKAKSFRDIHQFEPTSLDLIIFKSQIELVISKDSKVHLALMKDHSYMDGNLYRALDYIQDFRLKNIQNLDRLSPSKFTIQSISDKINIDKVNLLEIFPILESYYNSLFKAYEDVLDEYFPNLKSILSCEKYNFILNPTISYHPMFNDNTLKIVHLSLYKVEKTRRIKSEKLIIEYDFQNIKIDFKNALIIHKEIKYRFIESSSFTLSELYDDLPIRKGVYSLLKKNLEKFFKEVKN